MAWTSEQLKQRLESNPALARRNASSGAPTAKQEQTLQHALPHKAQAEGDDTGRTRICYQSYRVRLLDPENEETKFHTDALRYCGIIQDDRVQDVEIILHPQVKVMARGEERTEITIERIV